MPTKIYTYVSALLQIPVGHVRRKGRRQANIFGGICEFPIPDSKTLENGKPNEI